MLFLWETWYCDSSLDSIWSSPGSSPKLFTFIVPLSAPARSINGYHLVDYGLEVDKGTLAVFFFFPYIKGGAVTYYLAARDQ